MESIEMIYFKSMLCPNMLFDSKEECWNEMLNHEPFGWIIDSNKYYSVSSVSDVHIWLGDNACFTFDDAFNKFNFADGTPFGIKEE